MSLMVYVATACYRDHWFSVIHRLADEDPLDSG